MSIRGTSRQKLHPTKKAQDKVTMTCPSIENKAPNAAASVHTQTVSAHTQTVHSTSSKTKRQQRKRKAHEHRTPTQKPTPKLARPNQR